MGIPLRRHQGPGKGDDTALADLVHFLLEMYASQGVAAAKPLSESADKAFRSMRQAQRSGQEVRV